MSQPAVLQVVILRDGLLVGTEVFVPGSYVLGSADDADLRLDDAAVDPHHAVLYFQNGKAAVQDSGSVGGLYVNGHQVTACEIRSVDEVVLGPFVLKTRVLGPRVTPKTTPPPEVSALLGSVAPADIPQVQPLSSPRRASAPPPPPAEPEATAPAPYSRAPAVNGQVEGGGTMPSARRRKGKASRHDDEPLAPFPAPPASELKPLLDTYERPVHPARPPPERPWGDVPRVSPVARRAPDSSRPAPRPPAPPPAAVEPVQVARPAAAGRRPAGAAARRPHLFAVPTKGGRGRPRIYFELYWQDARQVARSFGPTSSKKPITSGLADVAMVPFYGFSMPEGFPLAESAGRGAYRVYLPPRAELDKRRSDGRFVEAGPGEVEQYDGRKCVLLQSGNAVALREGDMTCFAYVAPPPARTFVNPLRGKPWFFIFLFLAFFSPTVWWIWFGPQGPELADFNARNLNPVAVRLMVPKKEEKKKEEKKPEKKEEKVEKKEEKKPEKKKEPEKKVITKAPPLKTPPPPVPPPPAAAGERAEGAGQGVRRRPGDEVDAGGNQQAGARRQRRGVQAERPGRQGPGGEQRRDARAGRGDRCRRRPRAADGQGRWRYRCDGSRRSRERSGPCQRRARSIRPCELTGANRQRSSSQGNQLPPRRDPALLRSCAAEESWVGRQGRVGMEHLHPGHGGELEDEELNFERQLGRGVHPPLAQHLAVPARQRLVGDHQLSIHLQRGGFLIGVATLEPSGAASPTVQDTT